jgi:hypothetical protein
MTIADLSYWLEKNGKVISVGKLEDIITLYCEKLKVLKSTLPIQVKVMYWLEII